MRITGGELGGRKFKAPPGHRVRPTQDRVREALFSMIAREAPDARFLDLFAGSGAVGLDACSRGARLVTWVERDSRNVALVRENVAALAPACDCEVVCSEALRWLRGAGRGRGYDVVFADPPYEGAREAIYGGVMRELAGQGVLRGNGLLAVELPVAINVETVAGWELLRDRSYGRTRLALYRLLADAASAGSRALQTRSATEAEGFA